MATSGHKEAFQTTGTSPPDQVVEPTPPPTFRDDLPAMLKWAAFALALFTLFLVVPVPAYLVAALAIILRWIITSPLAG